MNKNKIRVGIVFGGKSAEHEVSINSARSIYKLIDTKKYKPSLIYVKRNGKFNEKLLKRQDVVFPVIHGQNGEDGTLQGLLKFFNIAFVGASVLGSAIAMDKDVSKRLLEHAGLPVIKFLTIRKTDKVNIKKTVKELGFPLFVKPANQGSSYGISKVNQQKDLRKAIDFAFKYDSKVIIEKFVLGREIECGVIGNNEILVSVPGEIFPRGEFHDFDSKYSDSQAAVPAKLTKPQQAAVKALAKKAYQTLECSGMARADFFLTPNGTFVINEINTIPGFTSESMFPKLWIKSGVSYKQLINKLIALAFRQQLGLN